MLNFAAVFIGGGFGAALRYITGMLFKFFGIRSSVAATFFVNAAGSFILGFLAFYFYSKSSLPQWFKLMLTVGFCGGLTTFSTFSVESLELFYSGRYTDFFVYLFMSMFFCILMAALGASCANRI